MAGDVSSDVGTLRGFLLNCRVGDLACHDQIIVHRHVVIVWCEVINFNHIAFGNRLHWITTNHVCDDILVSWRVYKLVDVLLQKQSPTADSFGFGIVERKILVVLVKN